MEQIFAPASPCTGIDLLNIRCRFNQQPACTEVYYDGYLVVGN